LSVGITRPSLSLRIGLTGNMELLWHLDGLPCLDVG